MKILLIQPGLPKNLKMAPQCAPPMGLMCLAAYLRENRPQDTIRILDMQVNWLEPEDIAKDIIHFSPDVVGITSMSVHAPVMHKIASLVKSRLPKSVIIVGGPHAAAAPENILKDENIDAVAPGEGEITFLEFVNAVEKEESLENIAGLVLRKNGSFLMTHPRPFIEDLDSLPYPARDLIEMDKFFDYNVFGQNDMRAHRRYTTIFTSRACPYRCIYCHNIFGKKFRARSANGVLKEMEMLYHQYGIREFHINDDCFNLDIERAMAVFEGILDRKWKIHIAFPNGIRADKLPDKLLNLMKKAGVYKMNVGVESGSERIQKLIRKNLNLNELRDAVARADFRGIITHGFFMLGFPTETEEEMMQTINFACSSALTMAGFFFVNPYPNTELYRIGREMGRVSHFEGYEGCYTDVAVNLSEVSTKRLEQLLHLAYRKFYLNPARMAKIAWRIPHKMDLYRSLKAQLLIKFF